MKIRNNNGPKTVPWGTSTLSEVAPSTVTCCDLCVRKAFILSLHTAIRPLRHSRQVYIVHSGLQDEGLQVTISNYRRVL